MPKEGKNIFRQNAFLLGLTKRFLREDNYLLMAPTFLLLGFEIPKSVDKWGSEAENNPPCFFSHDAFYNRIDRMDISYAWHKLKEFSVNSRILSIAYDKKLKGEQRIVQTVMNLMFSAYSSGYAHVLALSDASVSLLNEYGILNLRENLVPELLAKEEKLFKSCSLWIAERNAGSDIKNLQSHAVFLKKEEDKELYRLFGQKCFVSSIDSEYAIVMAQIPEIGHSLFLLHVWPENKLSPGIKIEGLKNNFGLKGLSCAELSLEGALGTLIGQKGQGQLNICLADNILRFYNIINASSIMNRVYFKLLDYAFSRKTFGKNIFLHSLYKKTLAELDAKRAGALAMCFEIARLMGKDEEEDKNYLEALIPVAKMVLAKWSILFSVEAIECLGGSGYVEESGLPKMLREAQVLSVLWGTSNILALELIKSQTNKNSLVCLLKKLCERANKVMIDESDALRILRQRLTQISQKVMGLLNKEDEDPSIYLEPIAKQLSMSIGTCAMALFIAEAKPFIIEEDHFFNQRFSVFVESNLCGHFSL